MPTEYSLQELAKLTGVTSRTIRFYITQGLLPAPTQSGPAARYSDTHLDRLRLIRKLQSAHLPLAEIRARLRGMPEEEIAVMAETSFPEATSTASDYIRDLLGKPVAVHEVQTTHYSLPMPSLPPLPTSTPAPTPPPEKDEAKEPERAQWERISLDPDIELHFRRPLSRQQNKRVERLIAIARELLKED